ncbi:MAG: DUF3025 domain-containing protein [Gammaproteobacteria bacterium]|nr:DUF3025 domain-containing protein [Gammaproteobacteria bacterium]
MAKTSIDTWNPEFLTTSPIFNTIKVAASYHTDSAQWPTLEQLKQQFKDTNHPVTPVPQGEKPSQFEDQYEPRIYLRRELQTRNENWHDFFNAMVWLTFTKTKSYLNERHYFAALEREPGSNRSVLENAITLFDECGIIIISDDEQLLDMIRQHQWKDLFYHHKDQFNKNIFCYVFGHAIYEKALAPYIGMTCQALLINSTDLIHSCRNNQLTEIDDFLAHYWRNHCIQSSDDLNAFPVLGIPGLHKDNNNESFYENRDYFRPIKK